MANRIAGITIQIDGDTRKLDDSLKTVNKTISDTSSKLRDVEKQLKLDPKNTELLNQKQEYLTKSISATKDKLAEEKKALEQLKNADNSAETVEQQRALAREIVATEGQLKKLEDSYKEFGNVSAQKIKGAAEDMNGFGKKLSGAGTELSKKVTAPIVAIGTASMAAWSEVDEAMDTITQKTGASGDALADMQNRAKELATTIPTSFQEAGTAVGEVNTRFAATGDELSDLSEKFIKFSSVNGTDVNATIDQTSASMKAWGLEAKDAGAYLDTLNVVGQATGINVDALNASMASNATTFKEMGMSAADAATFLGQVEVSGMDSSTAMKGLQTAMKNAAADGKALPDALKDLQDKMGGSATDTEKLNACIETFGSKAGPQFYNALKNGTVNLDDFGSSINDNLGSVSDTFDAMLDPADQAQVAMNNLKEVGAQLGDSLQATLAPIIEQVVGKLRDFKNWFDSLDDSTKQIIVKIGLVAAAIGPVLVVLGTLISSISSIVSVVGTVVGVLGGPLTLAIAAIVAVLIGLVTHWDKVKEACAKMGEGIKNTWNNVKSATKTAFDNIKAAIETPINKAKDTVKSAVDKIVGFFRNAKLEFPKIKLPHFSISGQFSLKPPSVPHLDVDWYAKAMNNGMILNSPTIFGMQGGRLLGAGEAGSETVVGTNSLMNMIQRAVGENANTVTVNVYGAEGQDVRELADIVSERINSAIFRKAAVYA